MSSTHGGASASDPGDPHAAKSAVVTAPPGARPAVRRVPASPISPEGPKPPVRRRRPASVQPRIVTAKRPARKRARSGFWILAGVALALLSWWQWPRINSYLPLGRPRESVPEPARLDPGERFRAPFLDAIATRQIGAARIMLEQLRAVEAENARETALLAELETNQKVALEALFEQAAAEADLPGMRETVETYRALWPETPYLEEWRRRIETLIAENELESRIRQLWQRLADDRRGLRLQQAYLGLKRLQAMDVDVRTEIAKLARIFRLPDGPAFRFRRIPAGSFLMGSPATELERKDDETQHRVTIGKAFWMMETELTQAQWDALISWNPSAFKNPQNPLETASKEDALHYIRKLNDIAGTQRFRLPTEAEWEYACRAGTPTVFSGGNSLSSNQANFDGNYPYGASAKGRYRGNPLPVASLPANPWGLHDMHGNVWEFCSDIYAPFSADAVTDPTGSNLFRMPDWVIRGGGWGDFASSCRSASRFRVKENHRANNLGFRLVMVDSP